MGRFYEKSKNLDGQLMAQVMLECMGQFDYKPKRTMSEEIAIANLQMLYEKCCIRSKANIIMDMVEENEFASTIKELKIRLCEYADCEESRTNACMHWLYDNYKDDVIVQQICTITKAVLYKDYSDISDAKTEDSINPERVSDIMSIFVYFTLLVNDNYSDEDFNKLFVESWIQYYGNWMASEIMFKMNGSSWRNQFMGVFLFAPRK